MLLLLPMDERPLSCLQPRRDVDDDDDEEEDDDEVASLRNDLSPVVGGLWVED